MYKVIRLNDNTVEVVTDLKDIEDITRSKLGNDIADIIADNLQDNAKEKEYARLKHDSDMISYESSLESNSTAFIDILEEVNKMQEYIQDSKRIDRNKILEVFNSIEKIINNQI